MNKNLKVRLGGAYFIKSAEGRSSRVVSKHSGSMHHSPSERDRKLAQELLKHRR